MPRSTPKKAPDGQDSDSRKRKRSSQVIDLTAEDEAPAPKTPHTNHHNSTPRSSANTNRSFARTSSWTRPSPSSQSRRSVYVPEWAPPTPSQQHSQAERDAWLEYDRDDDIFENVPSSQSPPVAFDQYQKYGTLNTKIVGVRFYNGKYINDRLHPFPGSSFEGFATIGERITIKREPKNPYDPNASKSSSGMSSRSNAHAKTSPSPH